MENNQNEYAELEFIDEPIYIHGFPWRQKTNTELQTEYNRLRKKTTEKIIFPLKFSIIGYPCTNIFFKYERMNTPGRGGRKTTILFWCNNQQRIMEMSTRLKNDLFNCLNFMNHAPSQFPIMSAVKIYRHFNATKVLDPYAGWGDRCLAAMALDIDYIGIDCNPNLKTPYKKLVKFFSTKSKVKIIIDKCEYVNLDDIEYDFVLTSPPFWEKNKIVEKYNNTDTEYENFLSSSLIPVLKKCITKVPTCVYIPSNMYEDIKNIIGECTSILEFKTSHCCGKQSFNKLFCWL